MGLTAKAQHIKALTCPDSQVKPGDGPVTQVMRSEGSRPDPANTLMIKPVGVWRELLMA